MERFKNQERIFQLELENKLVELKKNKELVKKVNLFSGDEDDEFKVKMDDGEEIGIFKTWAVPVIPLLEKDVRTADVDWRVIESWKTEMQESPVLAWETLEKWRSIAELHDRRLLKIFNERELPNNKEERVAELFWRLKTAFAFAAPFYHIEAMVGDGNDTPGNPFSGDLGKDTSGGFLDMAGMLLPSALGDMVKAEKLNWKNLNWSKIEKQISLNTDIDKLAILMRVARMAGIKSEEVLFASNALEWIPVSVGGKKGDIPEAEAEKQLIEFSRRFGTVSLGTVARDMNGLVRFLNWTPLTKNDENFSKSSGWKYAAACETANRLIEELSDGSLVEESHRNEFLKTVLPQLKNLDASSARGRFALWMFENGWLGKRVVQTINGCENRKAIEMMARMVEMEQEESVIGLGDSNNRFLVGGKAAGLYEASEIFGKEFVGDGAVVTSDMICRWLDEDKDISSKIYSLEKEKSIKTKLRIASELQVMIANKTFPANVVSKVIERLNVDTMAVRSSSFDEDTLVNGSAAGIYESEVMVTKDNLGKKISLVISSFFSEKAVSYRNLHGLSNKPIFAILVHEFLPGSGGVVFSDGSDDGWSVFTGESPGHIVSGDANFDKVERKNKKTTVDLTHNWVDRKSIEMVGNMSVLAEKVLGGKTDMEFVVSKKGLRVLQLRMLNDASENGSLTKEAPKKWSVPCKLDVVSKGC